MADIEFETSDSERSVSYYAEDTGISLKIDRNSFSCFWTPKLPPIVTVNKLLKLGIIPLDTSTGRLELRHRTFDGQHWSHALNRATALPFSDILELRLGTSSRCITLERIEGGAYGFWCGIGGEHKQVGRLSSALVLTAPHSLIIQFYAMQARIFRSSFAPTEMSSS